MGDSETPVLPDPFIQGLALPGPFLHEGHLEPEALYAGGWLPYVLALAALLAVSAGFIILRGRRPGYKKGFNRMV